MRMELEKTEQDLDKLVGSIRNIQDLSNEIDRTLDPKRKEILRLDKINKDLSNLKTFCELPVSLKEDMAQLRMFDILRADRGQLRQREPGIMKVLVESLDNLHNCQPKLVQFYREPLISPLFREIKGLLNDIQSHMFIFFYEHHTKMSFRLLGDSFVKLFRVSFHLRDINRIS